MIPAIESVWNAAPMDGRRVMWENVMPEGMERVDLVRRLMWALKKRGRMAGAPGNIAIPPENALWNALWADRLG